MSNTHLRIYHPDLVNDPLVANATPADVMNFAKPKISCEYAEPYFAQYGHLHKPNVFEILIDNETLQEIPIPTHPKETQKPASASFLFKLK